MTDVTNSSQASDVAGAPPALELRGVDMHYGFVRALDSIDFHVNHGEVVGLLGDNGAGKSTLLKVTSGAHRPTGGSILVDGAETAFHAPSDATGDPLRPSEATMPAERAKAGSRSTAIVRDSRCAGGM